MAGALCSSVFCGFSRKWVGVPAPPPILCTHFDLFFDNSHLICFDLCVFHSYLGCFARADSLFEFIDRMAVGTVLENLSNRKLCTIMLTLIGLQLVFILLGAVVGKL